MTNRKLTPPVVTMTHFLWSPPEVPEVLLEGMSLSSEPLLVVCWTCSFFKLSFQVSLHSFYLFYVYTSVVWGKAHLKHVCGIQRTTCRLGFLLIILGVEFRLSGLEVSTTTWLTNFMSSASSFSSSSSIFYILAYKQIKNSKIILSVT